MQHTIGAGAGAGASDVPSIALRFDDPELGWCVIDDAGDVVLANDLARRMGARAGSPLGWTFTAGSAPGVDGLHGPRSAPVRADLADGAGTCGTVSVSIAAITPEGRRVIRLLPVATGSASPPARHVVNAVVRQALDDADPHDVVALLICDLDRFQLVNDSLGHEMGDLLLAQAAARLVSLVPSPHRVVPLGGDEFAVVCVGLANPDIARATAERLREGMAAPYHLAGRSVVVGVSVGVAMSESANRTPEELLRDAGSALHRAKQRGRGQVALADVAAQEHATARLEIEGELRRAIDRRELILHYQPEVSFRSGRVLSVEALVRWQHPRRGLLGPGTFVPLAEEIGLIGEVGRWVLMEGCRQAARWHGDAAQVATVRVNLSPLQLAQPDIVEVVSEALAVTGCPPERLCLEVTETLLLTRPEEAREGLAQLRQLGVRIAIDDFGTGYSSLSYLKDLPVQLLKIDKSFIDGIVEGPRDRAVVATVVHLALALGLEVTAEGVEHPEQVFTLQRLGVERGQGFLFARAVPADQVEAMFGADLLGALARG